MADKTAQLAKLSHMSQLPTSFFNTSGGGLIIRRRSRDPAVGTANATRPIERTRSCPAAHHGAENENESDCDCECESGNESSSSTASSLNSSCSNKSNEAVRTRPGVQKLKFKQDEEQQMKRSSVLLDSMPPVHLERIERDITHSGPVRTRSSRRNTWGSIMADEGSFILPVLDRDAMSTSSEDSGVESGVESARDERTATVDNKQHERRQKGRSLQLAHPPDAEIAPKAGGLRRSKENEDVQLPVRGDKEKEKEKENNNKKKDGKQKLLSTPKVMRLKLKDVQGGSSEDGAEEKAEKKKQKREDSKREKRERKELKAREKEQKKAEQKKEKTALGSNSSGGKSRSESEEEGDVSNSNCAPGQQPITVRRTLKLNLEGLPSSPRGGISVQSLLRVGDSVWAADSSGRITVFNSKGEVEKVIVVCTGRLYSLLLVNRKQVWVSAEDSVIRVYHADKYKKLKDLQSHRSMVRSMEVVRQPDDRGVEQVWSGDVEGNIIIWDTLKLKKEGELCVQYGEAIFCIIALRHSVWASAGGEIYRVNIRKLEVETGWTAHERPITDLLYMQDENVVLSCAGDGIIRVWKDHYSGMDNHSSLQSEASLRPASLLRELTSSINVSALCPASPRSGLRICAGHIDGAISLWDSDMNEVARVKCEGSDFAGIRYLLNIRPDEGKASRKLGETLWSATRDGTICVWDWAPQ